MKVIRTIYLKYVRSVRFEPILLFCFVKACGLLMLVDDAAMEQVAGDTEAMVEKVTRLVGKLNNIYLNSIVGNSLYWHNA